MKNAAKKCIPRVWQEEKDFAGYRLTFAFRLEFAVVDWDRVEQLFLSFCLHFACLFSNDFGKDKTVCQGRQARPSRYRPCSYDRLFAGEGKEAWLRSEESFSACDRVLVCNDLFGNVSLVHALPSNETPGKNGTL